MGISPTRLPRLLGILVIAFAPYERRPLVGAVELFPGMAIRLVHRWVTGRIVADSHRRAVLLWSETFDTVGRRLGYRQVLGVVTAVAVGIAVVVLNCSILLLPVGVILVALGVARAVIVCVVLVVVGARGLVISWRALESYRAKLSLTAKLPPPSGLRWRVDFLAAVPSREGFGGHLLAEFLGRADERGAEVVLHCDSRNVPFYRHFGFHVLAAESPGGQRLMLRRARTRRGRATQTELPLGTRRSR
jgi:hypothetical protein